MGRGQNYSRDEWLLLFRYFVTQREATQTDSHPALVEFAELVGRTRGSVDANLRTIKRHLTREAGFSHGAAMMRKVVDEFREDPAALDQAADDALARIRRRQRR